LIFDNPDYISESGISFIMTMVIGFDTLIDTHKAVGAISNTRSTPVFQLGRNVELSFGQPPETTNDFF